MKITVKRIYETPNIDDGYRVLIDRLWPRGVRKTEAALDEWCKDVAPSTPLRKWFGHDRVKFEEFKSRYILELDQTDACKQLLERARRKYDELTLLYSAKDIEVNHAVVLKEYLETLKR